MPKKGVEADLQIPRDLKYLVETRESEMIAVKIKARLAIALE